jgi:hypothetical protein
MRLEKNGLMPSTPKLANRSPFSRKNCLFSGKRISNRSRLVTWLSTSTCEKSGLKVRSRFREE